MRQFKTPLAENPSEFLDQALKDLQLTEKMARVVVNFNAAWCKGNGKVTITDFAGCTIMQRDDAFETIRDGLHVNPDWYHYYTATRLYCLSGIAMGRVVESLITYRVGDTNSIRKYETKYGKRFDVPNYHTHPIDFFIRMKRVCIDLAEFGL